MRLLANTQKSELSLSKFRLVFFKTFFINSKNQKKRGKINDEGIESLCSVLTCLPLLTYLNLNLRENIELSNYNSLFKAILGLKYLYHLGVLIMQRNFSEDEFKRFIRDVVTKLKFLKSVHFEHNGFDISVKNCRNFYSLGDFTQLVKVKIILVVLIYDELESVRNI